MLKRESSGISAPKMPLSSPTMKNICLSDAEFLKKNWE
jgi:hypothetical protein